MINLLILIPVHGREEVRKVAFSDLMNDQHSKTTIRNGIKLFITHIESAFEGETLGAKLNRGLSDSKGLNWEYVMVLGSDDLLRSHVWGYIRVAIEEGLRAFGFNKAYLYDRINHRAKIWDAGPGTFGAGRCVRRDVVKECGWELWDNAKNNGIDNSQERIIFDRADYQPIFILDTHIPVICDIKDNDNLNSFDDVPGLPVSAQRVRGLFPALSAWPLPRPLWTVTATSEAQGGGFDL